MNHSAPNEEMFAPFADRLMDDDEDTRYSCASEIQRLGRPAVAWAIELADDPRPRMREMACYILGQIRDPDAKDEPSPVLYPDGIPTFLRLLESDPEEEVRASAAAALGHQAAPSTLPALCRVAADPSPTVRFDVAVALGSFYEPAWTDPEGLKHRQVVIDTLLRLMDDEDEDVRDWATLGIRQGNHDTPAVRARLWQALDDPCPDIRGEAAIGLAEFGDRSLAPRLEALLREEKPPPPLFFEAAALLGDAALLSAVLDAAERWREFLAEGEELHWMVTWAIEALQQIADHP